MGLSPEMAGVLKAPKRQNKTDNMNTEGNNVFFPIFLSSLSVTQLDSGVQRKFLNGDMVLTKEMIPSYNISKEEIFCQE